MDVKELNETVTRLNARLRELSLEKLSKPIPVKKKKEKKKDPGFLIFSCRDLLWLPIGTFLYADNDYFMKKSTGLWTSTFHERPLSTKEIFALFVSFAADNSPIYFIHIPDYDERA